MSLPIGYGEVAELPWRRRRPYSHALLSGAVLFVAVMIVLALVL